MQREDALQHRQPVMARQFHHGLAGHAQQDAQVGRRRPDLSPADQKDIVGAALAHIPVAVQHQRLIHPRPVGLDARQDVVHVVQGLRLHRQSIGPDLPDRRRHDPQPALVRLLRIQLDGVDDNDDRRSLALPRIEAQIAHAPRNHRPDVGIAQPAPAHRLHNSRGHVVLAHRDLEHQVLRGIVQAVQVPVQPEDPAVVGADALEDSVPIEVAVVVDRDLRLFLGNERAVDIRDQTHRGSSYDCASALRAPTATRARPSAAPINSRYSGCGRFGRDRYSA